MKRKTVLILIEILFLTYLIAQDGSNIRYYDSSKLDSAFIGEYCHIDFGEISSGGQFVDTIEIDVKGQLMKFIEHREDDGYNNWFDKQYLIRIDDKNQWSTRLQASKIDSVTLDKIYVTSALSYYINESPIDTITVFQHWYEREKISSVLIKID